MSLARRLMFGGGSATLPTVYAVSGPYDPEFTPGATVLTQLHCHTNASDGSYSPATVVAGYLAAGYDALQLSDHDKITTQPAGITTAISGNEHSPSGHHIIATNSPTYVRGGTTDAQAILDGIESDGGKAHIAHPKWLRGMTTAEMSGLTKYMGFEIHNGHCVPGAGQNPVTYPGFAIDQWDEVLRTHRRDAWGFSVDDLHTVNAYTVYDMGRVRIFAASNTVADLMTSLVAGNFVADIANHGVTPGYPVRSGTDLSVDCTGATRIEAWGSSGLLSSSAGTSHTHTFTGDPYVRLVAVGDYTEPFSADLSDRWQAVDGTWAVAGGVLSVSSTATVRRLILRRQREGDFTAKVDVRLGTSADSQVALMFNVLNSNFYYMLRIGESGVAAYNNKLAVGVTTNNNFTTALASADFDPAPETWYTIAMAYTAATGRIQAKVWERAGTEPESWQVDVVSTSWRHGAFGLRSNRDVQHDNFYVDGFRTYYQPVAVDAA